MKKNDLFDWRRKKSIKIATFLILRNVLWTFSELPSINLFLNYIKMWCFILFETFLACFNP
jgi:hypothetical protein